MQREVRFILASYQFTHREKRDNHRVHTSLAESQFLVLWWFCKADLSIGVPPATRGAVWCVSQVCLEFLWSSWSVLALVTVAEVEDRV